MKKWETMFLLVVALFAALGNRQVIGQDVARARCRRRGELDLGAGFQRRRDPRGHAGMIRLCPVLDEMSSLHQSFKGTLAEATGRLLRVFTGKYNEAGN